MTLDQNDTEWGMRQVEVLTNSCPHYVLARAVAFPFYAVVIALNLFVLYVWNAETEFHPTVYLLKALACSDVIYSVTFMLFQVQTPESTFSLILVPLFGHRGANACIGLVLALTRLCRLIPSTQSRYRWLFSRGRLQITLSLVFAWNFSIKVYTAVIYNTQSCLNELQSEGSDDLADRLELAGFILNDHVANSIPALLQLLIMARVLWWVRSFMNVRGKSDRRWSLRNTTQFIRSMHFRPFQSAPCTSQSFRTSCTEGDSSGGNVHYKASRRRKMECTIFLICLCNFLTFFVMRWIIFIFKVLDRQEEVLIAYGTLAVVLGINSIVNLVFYSILMPRFRFLANTRRRVFPDLALNRKRAVRPGAYPLFRGPPKKQGQPVVVPADTAYSGARPKTDKQNVSLKRLSESVSTKQLSGNVSPKQLSGNVSPKQSGNVSPKQLSGNVSPKQLSGNVSPKQSGNVSPKQLSGNVSPKQLSGNVSPKQLSESS